SVVVAGVEAVVRPRLIRRHGEDALPARRTLDHEEVASAVAEVLPEGAGAEGVRRVVGDGDAVGTAGQHPPGGEADHIGERIPGDAGLHLGLAPGGAPVLGDDYSRAAHNEQPARQIAAWYLFQPQVSGKLAHLLPGGTRIRRA